MVKTKPAVARKVIIAEIFLLSKLNYIMQALLVAKEIAAQIDIITFNFLWQKKTLQQKSFRKD